MKIKYNNQHIRAFCAMLNACSTVRKYAVQDNRYFLVTFCNNGFSHDDMTQALALLWSEHKATWCVPLGGKYYAKIKPSIDGKYAAFDLILTENDKRRKSCVYKELYNSIGGYWYTPSHTLNKTGMEALNSPLFTSLRSIISAFNRAHYVR